MTHSYFIYACLLDEKTLGVDWRTFRKTYIEKGGDGLYGSCLPVHLEPIYKSLEFYGSRERAPHFDPRYRGSVKSYNAEDYPAVESFRKRMCWFKTSMQTLEKVENEVQALRASIRHYT